MLVGSTTSGGVEVGTGVGREDIGGICTEMSGLIEGISRGISRGIGRDTGPETRPGIDIYIGGNDRGATTGEEMTTGHFEDRGNGVTRQIQIDGEGILEIEITTTEDEYTKGFNSFEIKTTTPKDAPTQ